MKVTVPVVTMSLIGAIILVVVAAQFRMLAAAAFLVALVSYAFQGRHKRYALTLWALVVSIVFRFLPVGVSFRNCDGPPRIIEVDYGLPGPGSRIGELHSSCKIDHRGDAIPGIFPP